MNSITINNVDATDAGFYACSSNCNQMNSSNMYSISTTLLSTPYSNDNGTNKAFYHQFRSLKIDLMQTYFDLDSKIVPHVHSA